MFYDHGPLQLKHHWHFHTDLSLGMHFIGVASGVTE